MKRVHIGGLFDGVKESDLTDRFGKFGKISTVEIKSKHNATGDSKFFAYMNIEIDDKNLKQCMKVYNKTKWKGHELHLQLAKENFLERLHKEQTLTKDLQEDETVPPVTAGTDVSIGHKEIKETTVKGAKPGTEVEDMKNWVVGKYGRVLPVVYIRRKDKKKIMKVDPSKYCHAVKKMDQKEDSHQEKSVTDLTWEVNGPDSDMVKKRMGEFPEYTPKRRKTARHSQQQSSDSKSDSHTKKLVPMIYNSGTEEDETDPSAELSKVSVLTDESVIHNGNETNKSVTKKSKLLETPCQSSRVKNKQPQSNAEGKKSTEKKGKKNASLVKSDKVLTEVKQTLKLNTIVKKDRKLNKRQRRLLENSTRKENESNKGLVNSILPSNSASDNGAPAAEEYDSADTDEIIACTKKVSTGIGTRNVASVAKLGTPIVNMLADEYYGGLQDGFTRARGYTSDNESDCDVFDSLAKGKLKKLFKSKKANVNVTLADMPIGAKEIVQVDRLPVGHLSIVKEIPATEKIPKTALSPLKKVKVAESTLSEGDSSSGESSSSESQSMKLPNKSQADKSSISKEPASSDVSIETTPTKGNTTDIKQNTNKNIQMKREKYHCEESSSSEESSKESSSSEESSKETSSSEGVSESGTSKENEELPNIDKSSKPPSEDITLDKDIDKDIQELDPNTISKAEKKKKKDKKSNVGDKKVDKHKLSNQQRLQSLTQRQEEAKNKQNAIQQALSSVDSKSSNRKVVFDSDSDDTSHDMTRNDKETTENGAKPSSKQEKGKVSSSSSSSSSNESEGESSSSESNQEIAAIEKKKTRFAPVKSQTSLFGNSSEDEDDSCEEDAFKVREEFEGKAGRKLMELQSKFANDKRFKLDKRFLEEGKSSDSSEEEEIEEIIKDGAQVEKEKSLEILASVVKGVKVTTTKADKKASFRDISSMRFDPSIDDHHQLEIKPDPEKLKKTKKRKKEQKTDPVEVTNDDPLPEVSTEKFYEVEKNLKDIFQPQKEESFSLLSMFGNENENISKTPVNEEECKPIEPNQMPWQKNFSYDSSEDEEIQHRQKITTIEDSSKAKKDITVTENNIEDSFFCSQDDHRIKDGLNNFCRTEDMEDLRVKWQEKRADLVEAYRKRRKQALRKSRGVRQQFKFSKTKKFGSKK